MATAIEPASEPVAIGSVISLFGTAQARNPLSGEARVLRVGDRVFADETLVTGDASALAIELFDGRRLDLGRNSEALLDGELFDPSGQAGFGLVGAPELSAGEPAEDAGIDAIQQALLAGEDPSELEATAAGPGAGGGEDEGSDFVLISRSRQATTPDSGFDTTPIAPAFNPAQPEDPPVPVEEGTVVENLLPEASDDLGEMDEDDAGVVIPNLNDVLGNDPHVITWTSQGQYGTLQYNAGTGQWEYIRHASLDHLAQGESVQDVFEYLLTDADGDASPARVIVTIRGTNDAPIFLVGSDGFSGTGMVREIADRAEGENIFTRETGGSLLFGDVDLSDSHIVSVVPGGEDYLGSFSAALADASTGDGQGNVAWTYRVSDALLDSLSEGQQIIQTYTVTVTDPFGASATHVVTVTITGSNDGPEITAADDSASLSELADGAEEENNFLHAREGTISFADVDLLDGHEISILPQGGSYLGQFSAILSDAATGDQSGTISWTFRVQDADIDYLGQGETLEQNYLVTVTDDHGASDQKLVTIRIIGTNDAPVIRAEGTDGTGAVREIIEDDRTENLVDLTDTGLIAFADADLADAAHGATVVNSQSSHTSVLGQLLLGAVNQVDDTVRWTYKVADAAVNFLREGQTITETFTVRISDGQGGETTQQVVVTITGSNDRPVVSGLAVGTVTEDGDSDRDPNTAQTASGQLVVTDDDIGDDHTWSSLGLQHKDHPTLVFGTFSVDATGKWTYTLNNSLAQQLAAGETYQETYRVQVQDNSGVAASDKAFKDVVITIVGTNDAPVVGAATAVVSEEGLPGGLPDSTGTRDTTNENVFRGSFSISDIDNDLFQVSLVKPADGVISSGGVGVVWSLSADAKTLTGTRGVGGDEVMKIVVTDAGDYTVTLLRGIDHPLKNVEDVLSFDVTVHVSDGVSVIPTTLSISVEDDAPAVLAIQDGIMTNEKGTLTGQLQVSFGGDGIGTGFDLSGNIAKAPAGLVYVVTPGAGGASVLTAYSGTATAGKEYFILTVDASGAYQFQLVNPNPVTSTESLLSYVKPSNYPSGVTSSPFGVHGTTVKFTSPNGSVNVSTGNNAGIGVGDNHLQNERLKLEFSGVVAGMTIIVNDVHSVDTLTFTLHGKDGSVLATAVAPPPANAPAKGNGLDGVKYNLSDYFSDSLLKSGFYALTIDGDPQGDPVRISNFTVHEPLFPKTQSFQFDLSIADADGDTAAGALQVTISADLNQSGGYILTGTDGKGESMRGGAGNDIFRVSDLSGDSINGGDGIDTLLVNGELDLRGADLSSIEQISMVDSGGNDRVTLAAADVLSMNDSGVLKVLGDVGDQLRLDAGDSWVRSGSSGGFFTYVSGVAVLEVQAGVEVRYEDNTSVPSA